YSSSSVARSDGSVVTSFSRRCWPVSSALVSSCVRSSSRRCLKKASCASFMYSLSGAFKRSSSLSSLCSLTFFAELFAGAVLAPAVLPPMPLAGTFLVATLLVATQSPSCNSFPADFPAVLDETAGPLTSPLSAPARTLCPARRLNRRPQHQTAHYISNGSTQAI